MFMIKCDVVTSHRQAQQKKLASLFVVKLKFAVLTKVEAGEHQPHYETRGQLMKKLFIKRHKFYFVRSSLLLLLPFTMLHCCSEREQSIWCIIRTVVGYYLWSPSSPMAKFSSQKDFSRSPGMTWNSAVMALPIVCVCAAQRAKAQCFSFVLKWKLKRVFYEAERRWFHV